MRDTTPQELMDRLDQCVAALGRGNTVLKTLGLQKAQTEKDYKVRQAQEILKLRAEGNPVKFKARNRDYKKQVDMA